MNGDYLHNLFAIYIALERIIRSINTTILPFMNGVLVLDLNHVGIAFRRVSIEFMIVINPS